jgi:hypothetical protein
LNRLRKTIICASDIALSYATRQNEIFESHKLYLKVFSNKHLAKLTLLKYLLIMSGELLNMQLITLSLKNSQKYAELRGR